VAVWAAGTYHLTARLGVGIAPALTPNWLYPRLVWGGLWGFLFMLPLHGRWWLRGIPVTEKKALAPGLSASVLNTRACRAAETKDFDDKQGDPTKSWEAVTFNPGPGPPIGPNPHPGVSNRPLRVSTAVPE